MLDLLWLIPALPCAGFVVLVMVGSRLSRPIAASLGVISVGLSAAVALLVGVDFIWFWPENIYAQRLWTWIAVDRFTPAIGFSLDALSLVMILVVSVVGFLILLYSAGFMIRSEGYSRFFAYMNLFICHDQCQHRADKKIHVREQAAVSEVRDTAAFSRT